MEVADNRHAAATHGFVAGQQFHRVQFEILLGIVRYIGTRDNVEQPVIPPQQQATTLPISGSQGQFQKFVVVLP